jgi:hypothetical protein
LTQEVVHEHDCNLSSPNFLQLYKIEEYYQGEQSMYELKSAILSRHFQHFITFKAKIFSRSAILVLVLILFTSVSLLSQGNAGRILGTIADQTGGIVPGATVTITDTQRGVS